VRFYPFDTLIAGDRWLALVRPALFPDIKARLEQLNQFPVGNALEEFAAFLQENMARLSKVAREANVKLD